MELSKEELNLIRQWYNAVEDLNTKYLEQKDKDLMSRVMVELPPRPIGIRETATILQLDRIGELHGLIQRHDESEDEFRERLKAQAQRGCEREKKAISYEYILNNCHTKKMDYLKSIDIEWNELAEFPDCIGGFKNGYLYISGLSVVNCSLEEIVNIFEVNEKVVKKDIEKIINEMACNECKHHVITEADTVWENCYCGLGNGGMEPIHINNCLLCTNDYKGCLDYEKRV